MFNRVSADGYFASDDGQLDWTVPDAELDEAGARAMPGSDLMLFGRRTYDAFESFWPHALRDADASTSPDPHAPGRQSATMRAFAEWINHTKKIVFSSTKQRVAWQNSELVRELEPSFVRSLKEAPGKAIMIFGSGSVVRALTEHRLIDEYHFVVSPLFLGRGQTLIHDLAPRVPLKLEEAKAYTSGNVVLRYSLAG